MNQEKALSIAITRAGGPSGLARLIGGKIVRQHVDYWIKSGKVPAEYCPCIERETGVRCESLRSDVKWEVLLNRKR